MPMQDLLHEQLNTLLDVDLLSEVYEFLLAIEPLLDTHNVKQADLACKVLIESLQGNTDRHQL